MCIKRSSRGSEKNVSPGRCRKEAGPTGLADSKVQEVAGDRDPGHKSKTSTLSGGLLPAALWAGRHPRACSQPWGQRLKGVGGPCVHSRPH